MPSPLQYPLKRSRDLQQKWLQRIAVTAPSGWHSLQMQVMLPQDDLEDDDDDDEEDEDEKDEDRNPR
jgi:hypothetical protein